MTPAGPVSKLAEPVAVAEPFLLGTGAVVLAAPLAPQALTEVPGPATSEVKAAGDAAPSVSPEAGAKLEGGIPPVVAAPQQALVASGDLTLEILTAEFGQYRQERPMTPPPPVEPLPQDMAAAAAASAPPKEQAPAVETNGAPQPETNGQQSEEAAANGSPTPPVEDHDSFFVSRERRR